MQSIQQKLILVELSISLLLFGCTDVQVKEERKILTDIGANEKVSFILDRSNVRNLDIAKDIEIKIENCIGKALKKLEPPIQTVSAETFRKTVFPDIDYLSVPSSMDSIMILLKTSEFKNRIKPLGLRYLLIMQGNSKISNPEYGLVGGGGGAALVGAWNKETSMSIHIVDLTKKTNAGDISAEAKGHGWFIFFGLGIGFPAISEGPACNELGSKIASFITGSRDLIN